MKKNLIQIFICSLLFSSFLPGQTFSLSKSINDSLTSSGLTDNDIYNIEELNDSTLYASNGYVIARIDKNEFDNNMNNGIVTFKKKDTVNGKVTRILPRGYIRDIATSGTKIWCAGTIDSLDKITGAGYSYSLDRGKTWNQIGQPLDTVNNKTDKFDVWNGDTIKYNPVVAKVANATSELAIAENRVYTANWRGGLRTTKNNGETWRRLPLPADTASSMKAGIKKIDYTINPNTHNNHTAYSLLAFDNTIWVGTTGGINRGIYQDSTLIWKHYSVDLDSSITGNWVKSIHRQKFNTQEIIWAACFPAFAGGSRGISYTKDNGKTWNKLNNIKDSTKNNLPAVNDIASAEETVFLATQKGLFYGSLNNGLESEGWAPLKINKGDSQEILSEVVHSVHADDNYLWIGTGDGLVRKSLDNLQEDKIYHEYSEPGNKGEDEVYAYPNPFYPRHTNRKNGQGHLRIRFSIPENSGSVEARFIIYDFNMEKVYEGDRENFTNSEGSYFTWNGKRENGSYVANGTYFCKVIRETGNNTRVNWTKIIVMK